MSRGTKLFVGLVSLLPMVLLVVFLFIFLQVFPVFFSWENSDPEPYTVFETLRPIFILGFIMALVSLGLLVFFIIHLVGNKKLDSTERVIWILIFLLAGIVGYPIYWYMRVWKDESF